MDNVSEGKECKTDSSDEVKEERNSTVEVIIMTNIIEVSVSLLDLLLLNQCNEIQQCCLL